MFLVPRRHGSFEPTVQITAPRSELIVKSAPKFNFNFCRSNTNVKRMQFSHFVSADESEAEHPLKMNTLALVEQFCEWWLPNDAISLNNSAFMMKKLGKNTAMKTGSGALPMSQTNQHTIYML